MAVYTNAGGGGGASSDELTAARGDVLKGKTAVTSDSSDEPVEGTLELTGDAADSHVLSGKTYYNKDPKTRRTGTMPNRGAVAQELAAGGSYTIPEGYHNGGGKVTVKSLASQTGGATATDGDVLSGRTYWKDGAKRTGTMANQGAKTASLNAGGSYTIPAGYHNGGGKVTANSLASQTSANAAAGHILSGKTAWVNGSKLTGTLAVQSAISFSAAALSATSVRISWKNPARGPWQGVFIQMSTSGNPGTGGGTRKYTGAGNNPNQAGGSNYVDIGGLNMGTTYYFTCTSYCDALGWGSSYNVAATTKGKILYDNGSNYVDIGGLNMGTTYYFTCTSYCDALGWGSSYNVAATTKGKILYDNGYNPYGMYDSYEIATFYPTYVENPGMPGSGSDSIYKFKTPVIDSGYSKMWFDLYILYAKSNYPFLNASYTYKREEDRYPKQVSFRDTNKAVVGNKRIAIQMAGSGVAIQDIRFDWTGYDQYALNGNGIRIYKIWLE